MSNNKKNKRSWGTIFAWGFAMFFLLMGIAGIITGIRTLKGILLLASLFLLIAGLSISPPIIKITNIIRPLLRAIIFILAASAGFALLFVS